MLKFCAEARCPACFFKLPAALDCQRVRRDLFGNDAARAYVSTIADFQRRDERGIRTDEGVLADVGKVLVEAVVIAGDGPCPDIRARTDPRIANIGQMVDLCAGLDFSFFGLDKIADMHITADFGARTDTREGTDQSAFLYCRAFKMREGFDDHA